MAAVELVLPRCTVRSWRPGDAASLRRHADDPEVSRWLRDRFPSPYTEADARRWLEFAVSEAQETAFAIEVDGAAAGGVGLELGGDVHRLCAELGFWLGRAHWGRGIASEAAAAVVSYGFERFGLRRIFAGVFATNPGSARVLEKCGFLLEGRLRRAVVKRGQILDQLLYAVVR